MNPSIKRSLGSSEEEGLQFEMYHENSKVHSLDKKIIQRDDLFRYKARKYSSLPLVYREKVKFEKADSTLRGDHSDSVNNTGGDYWTKGMLGSLFQETYGQLSNINSRASQERGVTSVDNIYPLELYVLVQKALDIESGLYHYDVQGHALELLKGYKEEDATKMATSIDETNICATIFITCLFQDIAQIYGERSYRYALLESGKVIHNMQLISQDKGFFAEDVFYFKDYCIEDFLEIDGIDHTLIAVVNLTNQKIKK